MTPDQSLRLKCLDRAIDVAKHVSGASRETIIAKAAAFERYVKEGAATQVSGSDV